MLDLSGDAYLWFKALHVIGIIAWMAALLYLPRLFVYHAEAEVGSELSETFKIMERRLHRAIMNPAMLFSLLFGVLMLADTSTDWTSGWLHIKLLCVAGLMAAHMVLAKWRKDFASDANKHPQKTYRIANEVPTLLMIAIVIMVILKPL